MAILTNGDNKQFVNDAAKFALMFLAFNAATGANEVVATPAEADTLYIPTYGHFPKKSITGRVTAQRPRKSKNHTLTIDSANAAQIALDATKSGVARFQVDLTALYGMRVELFQGRSHYGRHHFYPVKVKAGDSAATVLQRLSDMINGNVQFEFGELPYEVKFTAGVFTLTAKDSDYQVKLTVEDTIDRPSTIVTTFEPVEAKPAFEGVGQWANLQTERLETEARNEPYGIQQHDGVIRGNRYTTITFQRLVDNEHLAGGDVVDALVTSRPNFQLAIAQGEENEEFLSQVLSFLAIGGSPAASVSKEFTGTDGQPKTLAEFLADTANV